MSPLGAYYAGPPRMTGLIMGFAGTPAALATDTARDYADRILAAAGYEASLVTVPEDLVPPDLEDTRSIAQHFLVDSRKAATLLGWRPSDPAETIPLSVRWHLENPPAVVDEDFSPDDRALAAAET